MLLVILAMFLGAIAPAPVAICHCESGVHVLFSSERTPQTYTVAFSASPAPQIDPAHLSFTLVSYDKRRAYKGLAYSVNSSKQTRDGGAKARIDGMEIHVKVPFPNVPAGMYTFHVHSSDAPHPDDWSLTSINIYIPDRRDAHTALLRTRYSGATVWPYGPLALTCPAIPFSDGAVTVNYVSFGARGPVKVERVERVSDRTIMMNDFSSSTALKYAAIDPIVLHIRPASVGKDSILGLSASGPGDFTAAIRKHCTDYVVYAADEWDLARLVSLRPPDIDLAKHPSVVGLTHEEVAFQMGFPFVYKTRDEMLKMAEWSYERITPSSETVIFRRDRAVKYLPPGEMP
jgi:hypothetical protein